MKFISTFSSSKWSAESISYLIGCNIMEQFMILIKVDMQKVPIENWGIIFCLHSGQIIQYCYHNQKTTAFDGK